MPWEIITFLVEVTVQSSKALVSLKFSIVEMFGTKVLALTTLRVQFFARKYYVSINVDGQPAKYCVGHSGQRWDSGEYDGIRVYSPPPFCLLYDSLNL